MTKRPIGTEGLGLFVERREPPPPDPGGGTPTRGGRRSAATLHRDPASRRTDPTTSRDAGASMVEEAANQRAQILAFLLEHPQGATADALDEKLGWRSSTAGRRLSELLETSEVVRCDGEPKHQAHVPKLTQKTRQGRFAYLHIHQSHIDPSWLTTEEAQ